MFTGLVEDVAKVAAIKPGRQGVTRFFFAPGGIDPVELTIGESVAVDGCCLTVVKVDGDTFAMEATEETLARTTLGDRRRGDRVNVERALRMGDRLGGHLVTGHVDATGTLVARRPSGEAVEIDVKYPTDLRPYFVEKGSVALDGISLTVNKVDIGYFTVVAIPHTLSATTLCDRATGSKVNLETDLLGKYVVNTLASRGLAPAGVRITEDFLREHGFA